MMQSIFGGCCGTTLEERETVDPVAVKKVSSLEEQPILAYDIEEPQKEEQEAAQQQPQPVEEQESKKEEKMEEAQEKLDEKHASKFQLQLSKARKEDRWGLILDNIEGSGLLIVDGVADDGIVQEYNKVASEWKQLRKHDFITSINGETEGDAMLNALQKESSVSINVTRPREVSSTIHKVGGVLGMNLKHTDAGKSLWVKVANDNAATAGGADRMLQGDVIIVVNGKTGKAVDLLAEMSKSNKVELTFLRG